MMTRVSRHQAINKVSHRFSSSLPFPAYYTQMEEGELRDAELQGRAGRALVGRSLARWPRRSQDAFGVDLWRDPCDLRCFGSDRR